jgi:hypothetical protein
MKLDWSIVAAAALGALIANIVFVFIEDKVEEMADKED